MSGLLHPLSRRLGVTAPATLRKTEEFVRLLEVQGGSQLTHSTTARTIICLDVAASFTSTTLDKKLAVKLSGLTRPQYVALRQTVIHLLNLSPKITVADLCKKHSITAASLLAQQVFALYEDENTSKEVDLSLPVYATAAVQAACSVLKVKVNKQQLYESSSSKKTLYLRLVETMTTLAQRLHSQQASKSGGSRRRTLMELVEENLQQCSPEKQKKTGQEDDKNAADDYEGWKSKILKSAASKE